MKSSLKKPIPSNAPTLWILSFLCGLLVISDSAKAASATWLASPFNNNWIAAPTTNNWSTGPGTFPGNTAGSGTTDVATFSAASSITTINCASGFAIGGITFDTASASAYTINTSGGTWRLNTGNAAIRVTGTVVNRQTITGSLRMQSSGTLNVISDSSTPAATLNITTGISVNNSGTAGTLILGGTNTGLNVLGAFTEQAFATAPGTLIKTNLGTWVLTGNCTHHADTIIYGGTLALMGSGAIPNSPNIIIKGGTLSVSNILTSANNLMITNSSALLLTNTFFRTPLTIGTLTASNATFRLGINGATPFTNLVVTSGLTAGPNIAFAIEQIANLVTATPFNLISYAGTDPDPASFTVSVPSGYSVGAVTVDAGNKVVKVTVTPPAAASSIVWVGATNSVLVSNWNTNTPNWVDAATLSFPQVYADPDAVLFNDAASNSTVTLLTTVSPFNVVVTNNSLNYTFNGSGKISGVFGLSKQGSASLTLAETGGDNFSGGITVGGGTLVLNNTNSAISGGLMVASGTTVQIGNNDASGNLPSGSVGVDGSLIFSRSNNVTVSTSISGAGSLTQNGNGTLTLNNTNAYTGATIVSKGTLALSGSGSISSSPVLLVSNATFDVSALATRTTLLGDLNITNAAISVGPTNLQTPISVNTFGADGIIAQSNSINVLALPPIASYPSTITLVQSVNPITLAAGNFNFALGSLPAGSPPFAGVLSESGDNTSILLTLTAGPVGARPSMTWNANNNVSANTNWSRNVNWRLPGAPVATDNAIFDGSTTVADAITVNNVVDSNFTMAGLSYLNTNGQYQVTQIPAGNTLTINNTFTAGGFTVDGAVTHVAFTDGGTLVVNATNANLVGNSGSSGSSANASLDLSGLSNFVYNAGSATFGVGNVGGRGQGTIILAAASNNITAGTVAIMTSSASSSVSDTSTLGAGTNLINANTINIAATRASGTLRFDPAIATGGLRVRGTGGTDVDRATVVLGNRSSGGTSGTATGILALNDHPVDLRISTLTLGQCNQASPVAGIGTLQFNQGAVDVTTIRMGIISDTGSATGNLTVGANGLLVIGSGGLSMVNQTAAGPGTGNLTITGGKMICSNSIVKTTVAGTANITLTDGTLTLVAGTIGTTAARIDTLTLSDNGSLDTLLQLNVTAGAPAIAATAISASGTTTINVSSIAGVIGTGQIPLISYNNNASPFGGLTLGTVPAGYSGASLVDNTGNQSIDLLITSPTPLVWKGAVNSLWDTNTLNWLNGVTAVAYSDASFVQLDDTANTGLVTLATTVSSPGINVTNNTLTYTFNGTGRMSGAGGLVKQGPGKLVVANSGTNDFTGGVNLIEGTLQLGNNDTNGILPAGNLADNGTLTFLHSDDVTFANTISGAGGVSQINTNILTLSGVNSYTGPTFIRNGTLKINNTNALGSWDGAAVTITNGGTLDIGGLSTAIPAANPDFGTKQFSIAGAGVGGSGTIINSGANQQLGAFQNIRLTANASFGGPRRWDMRNGSPSLDLQGFKLTKTGTNQISLVAVNVTDGDIDINQGTLSFEVASVVTGSGTITVNSGAALGHFRLGSGALTRPIVLNGGAILNLATTGADSANDAPITLTANSSLIGSTAGNAVILNGVITETGGSFGLTKTNAGGFVMTANNTYSGGTIINAGTLALSGNGSISNSASIAIATGGTLDVSALSSSPWILNASQTLSGSGTVTGAVATVGNATIAPGSASAVGVMTATGDITLNGTNVMKLNQTTATNDVLVSRDGVITYGGTLYLTNLSGTLSGSSTFKLFSASPGNYSGGFSAIIPATPGPGRTWNTNTLTTDGILRIIATVNPNPTNITVSVSGNILTLSWPPDYIGWRLQSQTNALAAGLRTNWVDVTGSDSVNMVTVTNNPANGTVFYRMAYP